MEKYTVPQFIDSEDKIVFFLTVRQFLIILVTCGALFVVFKITDFTLFLLVGAVIVGVGGTFAFYRVNGQPFHLFALNVVQTTQNPSLRVWKKEVNRATIRAEAQAMVKKDEPAPLPPFRPSPSAHRLSELSLIVDTGGAYRGEGSSSAPTNSSRTNPT